MRTPLPKLKSLPEAASFLKDGVTFDALDRAASQTGLQAAVALNRAPDGLPQSPSSILGLRPVFLRRPSLGPQLNGVSHSVGRLAGADVRDVELEAGARLAARPSAVSGHSRPAGLCPPLVQPTRG